MSQPFIRIILLVITTSLPVAELVDGTCEFHSRFLFTELTGV